MNLSTRILSLVLFAAAPFGAAGAQGQPPAEAEAKPLTVEFRGNLRDALKAIAQKGGLNLVVTGDLDQDAEVYLRDVTAEEALRTVAAAYDLHLAHKGSIWTLRPMTAEEAAKAPEVPRAAAAPPPPAGPLPALPPAPPIHPGMSEAEIDAAQKKAEDLAEQIEARAEAMREEAEAQADALRERADLTREEAQERAEALREQAQEARELALEARAQAREIEREAREAIREATRNIHGMPLVNTGVVEVKEGEVVEDAVSFGGPVRIFGHVQGDAVSFGGDITLGPRAWVEGDVTTFGGSVHRADGAVVDGDIQTMGGNVVGEAVRESVKVVRDRGHDHDDGASPVATFLVWFLVLFGVGFVANLFVPSRMRQVQEEIRRKPIHSALLGFLAALALIPLTVLLMITLIGIPLAILLLWPGAMLAFAVGFAAVASELGTRLPFFRGRKTQAIVLAVGLAVLILLAHIPVLGGFVVTIAGLMGLGAIVATRFGGRPMSAPPPSTTDIPTGVPV